MIKDGEVRTEGCIYKLSSDVLRYTTLLIEKCKIMV
jgi:hypothetical protein